MRFEPDTGATIAAPRRACGNVVIDSVLQATASTKEQQPRPIFQCELVNMLARLKGPQISPCVYANDVKYSGITRI